MPLLAAAVVVAGATYAASASQKAPGQAAPISIGQVTGENIQGNITNAPEAEYLARRTNRFNQRENNNLMELAIPGWGGYAKSMAENATAQASGKISNEQASNLTRLAAERGINVGTRGQANDFSLLRDFGINQFQGQGQSMGIMSMLAGLTKVNPLSPMAFYSTPGQALGVAQQNKSNEQAYMNAMNQYQNQQAAAPWQALAAGAGTFAGGYGGMAAGAAKAASSYSGAGSANYGGGQSYAQSTPFLQSQNYTAAPNYGY